MSVRIITGHVLGVLRGMADESVHCVVTSPPYYGLRDYGIEPQVWGGDPGCEHDFDIEIVEGELRTGLGMAALGERYRGGGHKAGQVNNIKAERGFCRYCNAWRGSLGLEPTPALYLEHMVAVFREVRRVLRKDGTLWLNLGDGYASGGKGGGGSFMEMRGGDGSESSAAWAHRKGLKGWRSPPEGLKPKDLMMIPARVALALQADGWWLRSEITWAKRAPMPESCTDRPTTATEKVFLLTKSARYFYDAIAVAEPATDGESFHGGYEGSGTRTQARNGRRPSVAKGGFGGKWSETDQPAFRAVTTTRNLRNFWLLGPEPFPESHFAVFPTEIPRRAILAGTSARGVCPKCGAGWERIVKSQFSPQGFPASDQRQPGQTDPSNRWVGYPRGTTEAETIGWRPTCSCPWANDECPDPATASIPATVLDPFLGSGTTLLVADRLGRHCIGIELSPKYAAMSERRLREDAGMFADLAAE